MRRLTPFRNIYIQSAAGDAGGAIGAALATAFSITSINLLRLFQIYKLYKIHPYDKSYFSGIISIIAICPVLMVMNIYVYSTSTPVISVILNTTLIFCAIYIAFKHFAFSEDYRVFVIEIRKKLRIMH